MFEHVWSVLCERVSIDQNTNLVSYLTAVEGITAERLPISVQNLSLGTRWHKGGESESVLSIRLSLIMPDGTEKELAKGEQTTAAHNHRVNFMLNGLTFEQTGLYQLRLRVKTDEGWSTVQEIPLEVSVTVRNREQSEAAQSGQGIKEKKRIYKR